MSLLVFCLLYTPCVAAIASVRRELGGRWAFGRRARAVRHRLGGGRRRAALRHAAGGWRDDAGHRGRSGARADRRSVCAPGHTAAPHRRLQRLYRRLHALRKACGGTARGERGGLEKTDPNNKKMRTSLRGRSFCVRRGSYPHPPEAPKACALRGGFLGKTSLRQQATPRTFAGFTKYLQILVLTFPDHCSIL